MEHIELRNVDIWVALEEEFVNICCASGSFVRVPSLRASAPLLPIHHSGRASRGLHKGSVPRKKRPPPLSLHKKSLRSRIAGPAVAVRTRRDRGTVTYHVLAARLAQSLGERTVGS